MNHRITITPFLAALLASPVYAIEAPPDDAPPPADPQAEAVNPAEAVEAPAPEMQRAYLGVVAERVPEMLASHLGLENGAGIVLRAVMPDGPAAKAGLRIHDVITRLAGQPVGSSDDLTNHINTRQPGDVIKLDLIRGGKPQEVDVTLGNRPAELAGMEIHPLDQLNLDGIPNHFADRVRKMIEGNLGEMKLDFGQGIHDVPPEIDQAMREMQDRMRKAAEGMPIPEIRGGVQINQGATLRMMDNDGSIEIKSNDGGKEITVRDPQGKVTWTGPWDTEQDKAGAPEDIRRRVERLNFDDQGNGLRLRWNRQGDGP